MNCRPSIFSKRARLVLALVMTATVNVTGCHDRQDCTGHPIPLPSSYAGIVIAFGEPRFFCQRFALVPYRAGGLGPGISQVNFHGVRRPTQDVSGSFFAVYAFDQAAVSVRAFFAEEKKDLHQSLYPPGEYHIYEVDSGGSIVSYTFVEQTHMHLFRDE